MRNVTGALAQPVSLSTNKARGGVTGHNVRYVLAFGLAGIMLAFIIVGLSFGLVLTNDRPFLSISSGAPSAKTG